MTRGKKGTKIKTLTVEDNEPLRRCIEDMLKNEGYETFGTSDIEEAKDIFRIQKPHIVLLDIMLPGGSGNDLLRFFRDNDDSSCILMLTALDDTQSKRISYENGADDYLTKPFELDELVYKLAALRRRILSNQKLFEIGDIVFDPASNLLYCGQKSFSIQPSQMKLLKYLYLKYSEGTYFPKNGLTGMYGIDLEEDSRIQTLIARLRKNLSDSGSRMVSIETIYGKGYRISVHMPKGSSHA